MKKIKFEEDCEVPFKLDWMARFGSEKFCGVELKSGKKISYIPVPAEVRYCMGSVIRWLKTAEGLAFLKETQKTR